MNNKINNYNDTVGCELVKNIYSTDTNLEMNKYYNNDTVYNYPRLLITNDKLKQQNNDIYKNYMDHTILVNNCQTRFNIRNLNNAANLQEGYAENIDLDSELKRINHLTDKCYYDNYKYHPEEATKNSALYNNKNILVNDYSVVGKPDICAQPIEEQHYKSAIIPGHLQYDYKRNYPSKMSDDEVQYGYHTTGNNSPNERLVYQGCIYPKPEIHKCEVRPFKQFENNKLELHNMNINNQNNKLLKDYPRQKIFNNNTKRSTIKK